MPGWQSGHRIYPELQWLGQGSLCPRTGHFSNQVGGIFPSLLGKRGRYVVRISLAVAYLCPVGRGLDGKRKLESEKGVSHEEVDLLRVRGGCIRMAWTPPGSSECVHQQPGGHLPTDQIPSAISHPLGQDSETGLMLIQGAAVLSRLQSGTPSCELLNSLALEPEMPCLSMGAII